MSHLLLKDDFLFTTITIAYQGMMLDVEDVLVDTGSATTILAVAGVRSRRELNNLDSIKL